jgi:hypothetical protein
MRREACEDLNAVSVATAQLYVYLTTPLRQTTKIRPAVFEWLYADRHDAKLTVTYLQPSTSLCRKKKVT